MPVEIRRIRAEELEAFANCQSIAMFRDRIAPELLEMRRAVQELDRSIGAFDGGQCVGTASAFTHRTAVAGGVPVRTGGLTMVSVRATHRRQGILGEMMRQHFADCRERGEVASTLWAAEAPIYGRFGYGIAIENVDLEIEREHAQIQHMPQLRGRVRMVEVDEARETFPAIWDALHPATPGMISRTQGWWQRSWNDRPEWRGGFTELRCAQYEVDGEVRGYLRYRQKNDWDAGGNPNCTIKVEELMPLDHEAYAALWRYALDIDWTRKIEAHFRPADEPLYHMLADARRLRRKIQDGVWLRLLDIPAALAARHYAVEGRAAIEVTDAFLPGVGGTFALEGGPAGARCERTESSTSVVRLGVAELSAAYLGGTRLATLARAGRVAGDPAAVARLDAMLTWTRAPWCPEMF
jgi:predicted acetyltransferase